MSLLEPGTPINRETVDQAVEAIAISCALGVRQHQAIVRLIENGYLEVRVERIGWQEFKVLGSGLSWKSWKGLEKRLKAAGFATVRSKAPDGSDRIGLSWGTR